VPDRVLPGARSIFERYCRFVESLPPLAERTSLHLDELTFGDLSGLVTAWLRSNKPAVSDPGPAAG
jgi:hypothetical protein